MLLTMETLRAVRDGRVDLAFRRWRRRKVTAGGTLLTALGELEIVGVKRWEEGQITDADAVRAGHEDAAALRAELARHSGALYRITMGALRPDPRIALRETVPTGAALAELCAKLRAKDGRAKAPWVVPVLQRIKAQPETRAGDLCGSVGLDLATFKRKVRDLKALGLTESLEVGYRLSPRGVAVLDALTGG